MKTSEVIRDEIADLRAEVQAIIDVAESETRELADDEQARVDEILDEKGIIAKLEEDLKRAVKVEANKKAQIQATLGPKLERQLAVTGNQIKVPARAKVGRVKSFKNEEDAYLSGQYIMGFVMGNTHSRRWCDEHGIQAAMSTGNNAKGGYLVPEPLENTIIELREMYGVARQYCQVVPMSDQSNTWPKVNSELTAYYVGENSAITTSDMALEQVRLEAKKLATLSAVSSELNDDSVISVAEMLSRSIASQFAKAEDQALFLGDGTSTYGQIVGCASALAAGSIADAASGNTAFGTLDLADFEKAASLLPQYAAANARWYIHRAGYWLSMARLVDALSGNAISDVNAGPGERTFLGYPVTFTQVLPSTSAAQVSTHVAYLADLSMGALLGTRRGVSVVADESYYFNQDSIAIRATERYDINVHERGSASAGGAIIAVKTAAS